MSVKSTRKNSLSKLISLSLFTWLGSFVGFLITLAYTIRIRHETFDNAPKVFGFVLFGFILLGCIAFGFLIVLAILKVVLKNKWVTYKKSPIGIFFFVLKFLLMLAILPLFLLWRIFRQHETKLVGRLIQASLVLIILLPFWIGGYWTIRAITVYQLGYVPENMTVVGTGSMYPTWPRGTKGKDPKELAKEVIATAGFLKYPNGIVVLGNRVFGHTIGHGDIVTAENDEIRKSTEKIYGTPSGVMKRVIAVGGDTLELKDGIVYLNDQPQKEPYIAKPRSTFGETFLHECKKFNVPSDSVFLMGDNRKGSGDSREFGPVKYNEIHYVLPLAKQKGSLDKNWHDSTNDLVDTAKPRIDRAKFIELLNQKRKEKGVGEVRYEPQLEKSAKIRGEYLLEHNSFEQIPSYEVITEAMAKAGYWNSYVWEWSIQGYYEADELIEDYLERDWTDAKNTWFDKKFDDIGLAEVQGTLNGCPTQVIVVHAAGYIPATYEPRVIQGWRDAINNLNSIIPSWENARGKGWMNEQDLAHLLELLYRERAIATNILAKEEARQWLSKSDNDSISEYNNLANESVALANKLNGR